MTAFVVRAHGGAVGLADGHGIGFGSAFGGGFVDGVATQFVGSPTLAVPLATSLTLVKQPVVNVNYVRRPVVGYVKQPVATLTHAFKPVVSVGHAVVGTGVTFSGVGGYGVLPVGGAPLLGGYGVYGGYGGYGGYGAHRR